MAVFAFSSDVSDRFEGEVPARVGTLLSDLHDELYELVPDLNARVADGRVSAQAVKRMLVRVIIRHLRNPQGFISETAGDVSYSRDRSSVTGAGVVSLTADDLASIGIEPDVPAVADVPLARSVRLAAPSYCTPGPVRPWW